MSPIYPDYDNQPWSGELPRMTQVGPSDLRYSSGTAPFYQTAIDRAHGRHLAGSDVDVQDEAADQAYAANELAVYAEADDIQGNGVFDPPGTRPNINADAGILAARFDLPGYLARERMWEPSEVVDVTTGRPVVYVPSGAVSMDSAAQIAYLEGGVYAPPRPVMRAGQGSPMAMQSIVNVRQNPQAIGADDAPAPGLSSNWKVIGLIGLAGLAAGAAYASLRSSKRRKGK